MKFWNFPITVLPLNFCKRPLTFADVASYKINRKYVFFVNSPYGRHMWDDNIVLTPFPYFHCVVDRKKNSGGSPMPSTFCLPPSLSLYHSNKKLMYASTLQNPQYGNPPVMVRRHPFILTQLHTYTYYHTHNTTTYLRPKLL